MHGCEQAPRPTGSFFSALEDLERAASQLPATAEFSRQVANRYLGSPHAEGALSIEKADDSNVINRLVELTRCIDATLGAINYSLNRLSE